MTTGGSGQSLTDLINMLRGLSPINSMGGSDDLNRAWIGAQGQQNAAILSQAGQMQNQDQTNRLRLMELMGSSGGEQTDAATRWRSELQAQQDVQGQKLAQDQAKMLGYDPRTGAPTLEAQNAQSQQLQQWSSLYGYTPGSGVATLQARMQQAEADRQRAEQLGWDAQGNATMGARTLAQQAQQGDLERQLRAAMQTQQLGSQAALQQSSQGFQAGESAAERAERLQLQREQQLYGSSESAQERAIRQALQTQQLGSTASENAAQRAMQQAMQTQQIGATSQENAAERELRVRLQSGQLGQQESEFARSYLLQQDESRRKQSELSGYLNGSGGQTTEAARAARSQEATQRAALAAQLMQSPRDVFRGGAYFRSLRGADPTAMGLTGGGVMGFNSLSNRLALGLPGTLTPDDVARATGGADMSSLSAPGATQALAQGAAAGAPAATSTDATGGSTATSTDATGGSTTAGAAAPPVIPDPTAQAAQGTEQASTDDEAPGSSPGGPVGSTIDGQLGDLGMAAGGRFTGRAPSARGARAGGQIPYIDPQVFREPSVRRMTRDLRTRGQAGLGPGGPVGAGAAPRRVKATPSMVVPGPHHFGPQMAQARQNSDERFLRGTAWLNQQLNQQRPGTGPGGPVSAPLWPSGGDDGGAMPQLQDSSSLGQTSFQAPAASSSGYDPSAIPSVDPLNQSLALGAAAGAVQGGIGNLGPQTLERMSKSQRGAAEGAWEALGLNPDDVNQAYAQTRFANLGNVLSA